MALIIPAHYPHFFVSAGVLVGHLLATVDGLQHSCGAGGADAAPEVVVGGHGDLGVPHASERYAACEDERPG
jgi:hypothetical protein